MSAKGARSAAESSASGHRGPRADELEALLSPDTVAWVVVTADGEIRDVNDAALTLFCRPRNEMLHHGLFTDGWDIDDCDGRPLPPRMWPHARVVASGQPVKGMVLRVRRHDQQQTRWLRVSAVPRQDAEGRPHLVVLVLHDVTASQQRRRPSLRHMLRAVPGGMFRFLRSPAGADHFVFLNERAAALFDVPIELALTDASALWSLVEPADLVGAMSDESGLWVGDLHLPTLARMLRCRAVAEQFGNATIWNGVIWDVTEEHRLREQLLHAQRRETMGDLAAGLSHNFNNVLAAIIPNLQACQHRVGHDVKPMIDDALAAARGAEHLVRQLLVATRRETAGERESIDVATTTGEVVGLCRHAFGDKVRIEAHIENEDAFISARPSELHQVLLNLCMNARDALARTRQPRLRIRVRCDDPKAITISVEDNGDGMAKETLEHLGEPFFTTKPAGRGTGLGLASAYAIVHGLGGEISCESRIGVGTTFEIRLPRERVLAPSDGGAAMIRHRWMPPGVGRTFEGERVLIVDDDPLVRRSLGRQLRSLGLSITEADSGPNALLALNEHDDIAVVLLDLTLVRETGTEVLDAIRHVDTKVPVFIVTGSAKDRRELPRVNAVLTKPVTFDALYEALSAQLSRRTLSIH